MGVNGGATLKSEWSRMTWREVRARADGGKTVVLVPLGCVEPQGPHTPVGMEFLTADALAKEVARRTDSISLPAVPFGNSDDFVNMPGTVFIRPETLAMFYEDLYRSILRAGFKHVLFLAYHMPNQWVLERAARKVREEVGIICAWLNPGALAAKYLPDLFENPSAARGHGAEPGISLMRFLTPDAVSLDGAVTRPAASEFRGWKVSGGAPTLDGMAINMPINWDDLYPELGGYGNPTLGSAEVGKKIFERLVEDVCKVVVAFRSTETGVTLGRKL